MTTYSTIAGDMWDNIAKKTMGSEMHMSQLISLNKEHLNTVVFGAGIQLSIPDVPTKKAVSIPPWKK